MNSLPKPASELVTPGSWVAKKMKTAKVGVGFAITAMVSMFGGMSVAQATDLSLRGYGSVNESAYESYSYYGAPQSGRYRNLGEGYYRRTTIRVDGISNYSSWRSGSLSFELWAMPYYGANSGNVLMTTNAGAVYGRSTKWNVQRTGNKVALDEFAFPELNIWEYTRYGWSFADNIAFSYVRPM
jgi:hypothetical protein